MPDGKYLYDPDTQRIEIQWVQGIGSDKAAAPQARLMATVINGILNRRLPWRLVLLGVFLVIAVELAGHSLAALRRRLVSLHCHHAGDFCGRRGALAGGTQPPGAEAGSEIGPGPLYASGLIAGGGIFGLLGIVVALLEDQEFRYHIFRPGLFQIGPKIMGAWSNSDLFAIVMFLVLAASQFYFARKKMD